MPVRAVPRAPAPTLAPVLPVRPWLLTADGPLEVRAPGYALSFLRGRPALRLTDAAGRVRLELSLASDVDRLDALDEALAFGEPHAVLAEGCVRLEVAIESAAWTRKRLVIECAMDEVRCRTEVEGEGRLTDVLLAAGRATLDIATGSGRWFSGHQGQSLFSPEPTSAERPVTAASEAASLDVTGLSAPGRSHWFATPPPLCFALGGGPSGTQAWLAIGIAAPVAEQTFTSVEWQPAGDGFGLRLAYEGQTEVRGSFSTPALVLRFAPDPYGALAAYRASLGRLGLLPAARRHAIPDWWRGPIWCGWGAQCAEPDGGGPALARQDRYDGWLETLARNGVRPSVITIDDRWQATYGGNAPDAERWPDLRAWIAARHAEGVRVLLWLKAWDPDGLDPALCVTTPSGRPVAVDPSNPAYAAELRAQVRRMLGPDGLDADGLKVDFTARTPSGPSLRRHGTAWGVALLHELLRVVTDAAHATKPDALVVTQTPNPQFADVADMIRLNDVNTGSDVVAQMRHRAAVAHASLPGTLVDTDDWPMRDRASWRAYAAVKAQLGVPAFYFADRVNPDECLEEADWARVRSWNRPPG